MRNIYYKLILLLPTLISTIMAQGVEFPEDPTQAPIGGLGLLAAAGAAMAYKKLKDRNK